MAWTYETVTPSPIDNTTVEKGFNNDGVFKLYRIQAVEGYVLHDNRVDVPSLDDEGNETGEIEQWFKTGSTTVSASCDFTVRTNGTYTYTDENGTEVTVPVEMIGEYEFYTLPSNVVPSTQTM